MKKFKGIMKEKKSVVFMIITTFLWGLSFPLTSLAIKDGFYTFQLVGLRFTCAALILSVVFFKALKKANKKAVLSGCLIGLFLFLGMYFQMQGLKISGSPSKSAFLTSMYVIIIPIIALILFKKKISLLNIIAVILAFAGIGFITLENGFAKIDTGDLLTIVCAFMFAFQIIYIDIYAKKYDIMVLNIFQCLTCGVLSLIAMFIFEPLPVFTTNGIIAVLYNIIFSSCIAMSLQVFAQKNLTATKAGIICTLEGVFAAVLSVVFFKEKFGFFTLAGFIIILAAVIISQTNLKGKNTGKEEKIEIVNLQDEESKN